MANEIQNALRRVTDRIAALEQELSRLHTAADVLRGLEAGVDDIALASPTKTECIRRILRERGAAATAEIIRAVQRAFPDAKTSGIRSILSLGKKHGQFRQEGKNWSIAPSRNETAASV